MLGVALSGPSNPRAGSIPRSRDATRRLHKSFGARWVTHRSAARQTDKRVIVESGRRCASTDLLPGRLRRQERRTSSTKHYPLLVGVKLGAVRDFDYEARDKYALIGYLTLPPGAEEKICRWWCCRTADPRRATTPDFDWWPNSSHPAATRCCSRSFAAPRASARRTRCGPRPVGPAHAGRRHRRRAALIIDKGIVDPKRVCIVGRELRRLRRAGGRRVHPGAVRLRREHRRRRRSARDARLRNEKMAAEESDSVATGAIHRRFDRSAGHRRNPRRASPAHDPRSHPAHPRHRRHGGADRAVAR